MTTRLKTKVKLAFPDVEFLKITGEQRAIVTPLGSRDDTMIVTDEVLKIKVETETKIYEYIFPRSGPRSSGHVSPRPAHTIRHFGECAAASERTLSEDKAERHTKTNTPKPSVYPVD